METLKLTPIDEIEDMADGVPVLAVEGTVKYAADITRGTTKQGKDWTKQFFVLSSGTAEIACSMWDAEGNELTKGEKIHIENTQNKKGQWNGMVKGSYQKDGERKHTLEIRANQVKITNGGDTPDPGAANRQMDIQDKGLHGGVEEYQQQVQNTWNDSARHDNPGITEARKHLMQSANLYNLCVSAVDKAIAPNMPNIAQTSEQFQAAVGTLFIEASRAGLVAKMPTTPVHKDKTSTTASTSTEDLF